MTAGSVSALPHQEDQDLIDRIIGDQAGRPGALLGILEKLQDRNRNKYLPMETLEYVAARTASRSRRSMPSRRSLRYSTSTRRALTPWPSAVARPVTPAAPGRCSSA